MKKYKKILNVALFSLAIFGVANFASAATLNNDPADYAMPVIGSATVLLSSSQTIDYTSGTVTWRPNQTVAGSAAFINGQTGMEIFSASGLNLGDIAPGWSTQGSV